MFVVVICIFRKNIRKLIDRLKSISTKYGTAEFVDAGHVAQTKDEVIPVNRVPSEGEANQIVGELLQRAQNLSNSNQNDGAIDLLMQANRILPNQWVVLHNLGVLLIRLGKSTHSVELLVQAEMACKQALYVARAFPYGTLYNLARAQAASGNLAGIEETFAMMAGVNLPSNLAHAIVAGDGDFEQYENVKKLDAYQALRKKLGQTATH
jgi:tetratricopeptide (TPR) repeat protein